MTLFISKPTQIEAVQWTGTDDSQAELAAEFLAPVRFGFWAPETGCEVLAGKDGATGWVPVPVGHWVARYAGDKSDYWPLDPEVLARKYEPVDQ